MIPGVERLPLGPVSARERDVLLALAPDGSTNAEIAARLFLSVRTVESHVASLLRKTGAHDRRALLRLAPELLGPGRTEPVGGTPLTSFVGRDRNREQVAAALSAARLVTVVGAGGSGKTRLARVVLDDVRDRYPDGAVEVDLVPVADASRVPSVVAERFGLTERGSAEAALASRFRTQHALVLLDNCEHLGDALAAVLERLLSACPGLTVLATSRTRLAVPFETVVRLSGLEAGAAVELFAARAESGGWPLDEDDRTRSEAVCRALEGLPLAIELAAAQVPAIGMDGVEAALADPLSLLDGGPRAVTRHESLRATLRWSHDLLGPVDRAVLRRLAVITAPFPVEVAEAVAAGWPPVPAGTSRLLGTLVDASLLGMERGPSGTRYRLHEAVRRFAAEHASAAGEDAAAESRLLAWSGARIAALEAGPGASGRPAPAEVAVMRSAVEQAVARRRGPDPLVAALARRLATLLLAGGAPADAERLFTAAAATAAPAEAAGDLEAAAAAAETRGAGDASVESRRAAAAAWEAAGAPALAAVQLARAAELLNRAPGYFIDVTADGAVEALIAEAVRLAGDDARAAGRILTARAFAASGDASVPMARAAAASARRLGDVVGESAALDAESSGALMTGHVERAYAVQLQRIALLQPVRSAAVIGLEYEDALITAGDCAVALGDLATARRLALQIEGLPALAAEQHIGVALSMLVETIRGDLAGAARRAPLFVASWNAAGQGVVGAVASGSYAAATAFALLGNDDEAARWRSITDEVFGSRTRMIDFERAFLDLLVLLHRGDWAGALRRAWSSPDTRGPVPVAQWIASYWRPWYTALWVEAAVLAGAPDAADRVAGAREHLGGNPVAAAIVDRGAALLSHDLGALPDIAARFDGLDAPYQAARTRLLSGGPAAARGAAEMTACGATRMALPVVSRAG
jgi:predicted ATPase/DNA-binding CsgD family transcriptional regulator